MNIIQAIILGGVEGITEFLPVSSTFHLIFASKFLGLTQTEFTKLFEVFIQSGAILSVFFLFVRTLLKDKELLKKTIVAFIPTAIVGFALYKVIKEVFFNADLLMMSVFVLVGFLFIGFEYWHKGKNYLNRTVQDLTYKEAIMIGVIQSFAVIPGVSRAGSVILGMLYLKFKREEAARFSFMLSIPTIFAASALDLLKMRKELMTFSNEFMFLIVGFIAAFITSYFIVKWLVDYLKHHTLTSFGVYRIVVAIILLISGK